MTLEQICSLPVELLAARNCHLHVWVTMPFLFEAQLVIQAWGFEYKGAFAWVKPQLGLGNYWRSSHELLLLGVRGNSPFEDWTLQSWGLYDRRRHSEKPEEVRGLIERASAGPRLELFARKVAPRWYCWGHEVTS